MTSIAAGNVAASDQVWIVVFWFETSMFTTPVTTPAEPQTYRRRQNWPAVREPSRVWGLCGALPALVVIQFPTSRGMPKRDRARQYTPRYIKNYWIWLFLEKVIAPTTRAKHLQLAKTGVLRPFGALFSLVRNILGKKIKTSTFFSKNTSALSEKIRGVGFHFWPDWGRDNAMLPKSNGCNFKGFWVHERAFSSAKGPKMARSRRYSILKKNHYLQKIARHRIRIDTFGSNWVQFIFPGSFWPSTVQTPQKAPKSPQNQSSPSTPSVDSPYLCAYRKVIGDPF